MRRELLAEQDNLSGLVRETEFVIGKVARHGYAELNGLPAQEHGLSDTGIGHRMHPDDRYFKSRKIVRVTGMPSTPPLVPNNKTYVVTETSAETDQRTHYCSNGMTVTLPWVGRRIAIKLDDPNSGRPSPQGSPTFSIETQGRASYNRGYDYTYPHKEVRDPRSRYYHFDDMHNYCYYTDLEQMRDDYASAYSGALAVTGLVAASLEAAHGIESDKTSIPPLLEAWQNVRSTEDGAVSPDIVDFLPRDLAMQAGASF